MEFTREIYWNVGHGAATLVPMYLLAIAAIAALVYGFVRRAETYKLGKPKDRFDQPLARTAAMLRDVLLQTRVLRVKGPGLAHSLFFWGFALLFVGTALIVIQADFTDLLFDVVFLKGAFYKLFSLVLDLAGLAALVTLFALLIRRWVIRPAGLLTSRDDLIMHGLLFAILLTGFFIEGARMAVTEAGNPLAAWSPVGMGLAGLVGGLGESTLLALHRGLWWFHLLLAVLFIGLIPFTKFRHILTTSANLFLANRGPVGKLATIDLENENTESFGARTVTDMSWKDIFDADACTLCKRCQDRCPAYNTDKPLSPMQVVNRIGETAFTAPDADLIETVGRDAIWSCTTCRACQDICPAAIEHVDKIVELRRNLVLMEGEFPGDEVMTAMEQIEVNGNPLGMGYAARGDWAEGLGLVDAGSSRDFDVLYFVGCYASFDKRNIAVARSFVKLCQAAGLKVGILGKDEKCCGEPARKMGNEYLYQTMAGENIGTIEASGARRIVTTCPHCYNTLTKDYRDLGLTIEVQPHPVFLSQLVAEGRLKIDAASFDCSYHDSCYLGRHNGLYGAPRQLIESAGGRIAEMEKNRDQGFCCGAGGGRILAEEKLGSRINVARVQQAAATGTSLLLANCPFCLTMFEDGVKGAGIEESLRPRDIAEVLAERLPA
ncbi:4Fe-4S dicluster domain-containing protein [Desulfoprunum benzoelyticum]|uniref:Fe-S oxidoreductase/nitrate reductase gamma subunit n=1 Tax=Desulfoprunum benzoelyticum TaxID=1506996 RepID=A0A840V6A5_9BACT|nr:heterodisulfide reductase-related iron-sulfur binding cluster [Desulfoprunum benzoelyticum]MBB5349289.1 Fe-S oxidoreductase/nitrate reductase gamma subunit [Desulfoprunum benzoelyticum]MBM9530963.1 4Fe-4S dicluster domain-containing protein [Desulfoprunum benzoelyticum]